jgi:hypothetical protein
VLARFAALVVAAVVALATPWSASAATNRSGPPRAPRLLPGDAAAATVGQAPDDWLVGARPSRRTNGIAHRFAAQRLLAAAPVYRVERDRARAFVAALEAEGLYTFSEPDQRAIRAQFPAEPLLGFQWALRNIGATTLTPPPVTSRSPKLGIVDDGFDLSHPEWGGMQLEIAGRIHPGDGHQNMVASVAGAAANGVGMAGVWPGMRLVLSGISGLTCSAAARAVDQAVAHHVKVINMSYGFPGRCWTHLVATNYAYASNVVLVASAGNDGILGDRGTSPGEDPHIITVAALAPDDGSPVWSNANDSVDLAAPGEDVLAAMPAFADPDGNGDGYGYVSGTSFSAPLVAASTAWVRAERPRLDASQVTELIRYSARDLGPRGWDRVFGFGAFYLPRALTARAPESDYLEPNDDIEWVNGTWFQRPDSPVWRGGGTVALDGTLDQLEDPVDVYNFRIRPRSGARISIRPLYGNPDLEIFGPNAVSVYRRRGFIVDSRRRGRRTDAVWLDNSGRRAARGYVSVYPAVRSSLSAGYRLSFRRVPLGR